MITAYLLDASHEDLQQLKIMLESTGEVAVVGMSLNPREAVNEIEQLCPRVLFLEMQFPNLEGMAIAEQLKGLCPDLKIIVVTSSKRYALWAFEHEIADYVLKPLQECRVCDALTRVQ